eukprot:3623777-Karenia_brevis.AAC.1
MELPRGSPAAKPAALSSRLWVDLNWCDNWLQSLWQSSMWLCRHGRSQSKMGTLRRKQNPLPSSKGMLDWSVGCAGFCSSFPPTMWPLLPL